MILRDRAIYASRQFVKSWKESVPQSPKTPFCRKIHLKKKTPSIDQTENLSATAILNSTIVQTSILFSDWLDSLTATLKTKFLSFPVHH